MKITDFHPLLDPSDSEEAYVPIALSGNELQELVSPLSCEEFVGSYFSQVSLSVEGTAEKFDHIFNWKRLRQALARGQHIQDRRYNLTASFAGGEDSSGARRMMDAHHNQVIELLNAGATICITNIHMADPSLARWAEAIREQLNFTGNVGVNCYVSADGSGLPMHYDKRVATTLQIAGKKRWKYSTQPAKAWPDSNEVYQEGQTDSSVGKLPAEMEIREVELKPGDLLCLPAGAWHSARGVGFSLALNLYFSPRNLLDQLAPMLRNFATSNQNWRGGAPATLEKTQGLMPSPVSNYMLERLNELHEMIQHLIENPDGLNEPWLNSLTNNPYTGWQPSELLQIPEVAPDQQFCATPSSLRFIQAKDKLLVAYDNGVLRFPLAFAPVLRKLCFSSANFTIPEILSSLQKSDELSPNELVNCLKVLYANRIIKMVRS